MGADADLSEPVSHADEVRAERDARLARLRYPEGWLSLVGLEWLHAGENRMGADPDADVVLRGRDAPPFAGSIEVGDGSVRFVPAPRADVTLDGRLVTGPLELEDDLDERPTTLAIGSLRFHLIRRTDQLAIRVRDRQAETLASFPGLEYFPIDPSWRVTARFEPTPNRSIAVPDVIGLVEAQPAPGIIRFERDGNELRLDALEGPDQRLWLIFGDATNGDSTYGGGRFLYSEPPDGDRVVVDFNLAYNPPCVFTPYATCPLPWPENRLPIGVEAGEKGYALH